MIVAWLIVAAIFVGVPGVYYLQMRKWSTKQWKLDIDQNYQPSVTILVPVYNEEKTIRLKLENLNRIKYPAAKIETVIVNDASTDNTLAEIQNYLANNSSLRVSLSDNKEHLGKTNGLNKALESVNADVVIISDADCFWPSDILQNALPYLSDPRVGAITARELLLNPSDSWVTEGEQFYDSNVQAIRIGESKIHSTIIFQGGFAAYKREFLQEFDQETDDSGTALNIIQMHGRTLLIPEAGFYTMAPLSLKNKVTLKIRRAGQLQSLWIKCLKLMLRGSLLLPKKIAVPNAFLFLFNPLFLVALLVLAVFILIQYPILLLGIAPLLLVAIIVKKARISLLEALQNNLILLLGLSSLLTNRKFRLWKTGQESRNLLTENTLREKQLI